MWQAKAKTPDPGNRHGSRGEPNRRILDPLGELGGDVIHHPEEFPGRSPLVPAKVSGSIATRVARLKACVPCEDRSVGPGPPRNRVAACRGRGSPVKRRWGMISVPQTGSKLLKQKSLEEPDTSWFPAKKADFGAPLGNQRVPEV